MTARGTIGRIPRTRRPPLRLPALVGVLLLLAGAPYPAAAEGTRDAALGMTGELYLASAGTCGDLLAECPAGSGDHPVLVLDVLQPGAEPQRLLVPETEGAEREEAPAVVFEDVSQSVFLVWESRIEPNVSEVNLTWFDGESWAPEVVEISGDITPLKGPPQVVITRDGYEVDGIDGETESLQRTILHVVWWEEGPAAERVFYTPIVIEDGAYLGWNRVVTLSDLDPNPPPSEPRDLPAELYRAPTLDRGGDAASTVVGFANPATERFLTFEIQLLPGELSDLSERIRSHMIEIGHRYTPEALGDFAERIRSHMIEIGHRLHPAVVAYLATSVESAILSADPTAEPVADLSERIRSHMIEIGARTLRADGLASAPAGAVQQPLETAPQPGGPASPIPHQLWIRLVADRPAPDVGPHPIWGFLSEDGREAVVSWENDGRLFYRETTGEGWTGLRRIDLEGTIDADRAGHILRRRVRER